MTWSTVHDQALAAITCAYLRREDIDGSKHLGPYFSEKFAWFRDPAGNVLGIYQKPGLADTEHARTVGNE